MTYSTLIGPDSGHSDPRAFSSMRSRRATFTLSGEAPSWVGQVLPRFAELLELPPNWRGAPSAPIEPRLAELAVNVVLREVMPEGDAPIPQVVPRIDGGLQLEWHRAGWDVEVVLTPLGEIVVDCAEVDGDLDWTGDFDSRSEDLKLILKSIA